MSELTTNDNQPLATHDERDMPDPHGQTAMLLVESLIHGLLERSVLTLSDAIEIVATAAEVAAEVAAEKSDAKAEGANPLALLEAIRSSLCNDLPG